MKTLWQSAPGWVKWLIIIAALVVAAGIASALFAPKANAASVDLTWTAPTTNCDTSALTDLEGYIVKWWFTDTPQVIVEQDVGNVTSTSVVLDDTLVEGKTVVFAVTAYDTNGNRSDQDCGHSNEVSVPFGLTYPSPPTGLGATVQ